MKQKNTILTTTFFNRETFYCNILWQRTCSIVTFYYEVNIIDKKAAFAPPPPTPPWDNRSINSYSYFIYFPGVLPSSENWGLYLNNYPRLVCILALNATKEAIRLGGLKKLILWNNDKSWETHYRLNVINGIYTTRHVTHSIIY